MIRFTALVLIVSSLSLNAYTQEDENPFLGRWGLYLPGGAGWLEIRQEEGYFDGDLLWYGGSPVPVGMVVISDNAMYVTRNFNVVRQRDDEGNPLRTQTYTGWVECVLENGELVGTSKVPGTRGGITTTSFTGKKIPDVPDAPDL